MDKPHMIGHDIVAIEASAGGVEALSRLVTGLPAAVFVVVHLGEGSPGMLPRILDRAGPLEAAQPEDGDSVENGRVYVAPLSYTAPTPAEWEPSPFSTRARASKRR